MTKEELHQFAAAGVAQKMQSIERELAVYHKEWPELFLSATPPQLLKVGLKNGNGNGNGHWPAIVATAPEPAKPAKAKKGGHTVAVRRRRAETETFLAKFSTTTPQPANDGGRLIGAMIRYGYLKKKGDGFLRTAKAFTP